MINRRGFLGMLAKGAALGPVAMLAKAMPAAAEVEMRLVRADDLSVDMFGKIEVYLDGVKVARLCTEFYGASEPGIEVEGWARVFRSATPYADMDGEPMLVKRHGRIEWRYKTSVQAVEKRIFMASQEPVGMMEIYLNGVEVANDCTAFCGGVEPEVEVKGWADIIEEEFPEFQVGADGRIVTVKKQGLVKWRYKKVNS